MNKKIPIIISLLVLIPLLSFGQEQDTLRKKEIYFGVGPAAYKGDLSTSYDKYSMVLNAGIKLNRFRKLNGNFNISVGEVSGQNINYSFDDGSGTATTPVSFFTTKLIGLNYELHYNVIHKENLKLYISQGIGMLRFTPKDEFNQNLIDNLSTRNLGESYGSIAIFFPTQIGLLYTLPNDYSFGFQMGYLGTVTDYIDNISQWSTSTGNDNILSMRFEVHIPVKF